VYRVPVDGTPLRGSADALVTIVVASDFQCPFCSRVEPTLKAIGEAFPSKVRFGWKHQPLPFHQQAVPAAIVAGIGGILYYQDRTGDWESWSFLWTLLPGFVGIGVLLTGLLGEDTRRNIGHGINLLVVSAVLFLVFAALFQRLAFLGPYGPAVLLVLLGLYIIGRGLMRGRNINGG
jgi:peptidoglycan/LPS O-acetylase OafA/YrhL